MKLLPCPFCGSANLMLAHGAAIYCNDCGAKGPDAKRPFVPSFSEAKALRWNQREHAAALARERETALEDVERAIDDGTHDPGGSGAAAIGYRNAINDALEAVRALRSPPTDGTPPTGGAR